MSGCADSKYTTWLTFLPTDPTTITTEDLRLAQKVLLDRLDLVLLGTATVRIEDNKLRVGLTNERDSPLTTKLATTVGAINFFHSDKPVEIGSPVPSDTQIIVKDIDIDTASVRPGENDRWGVDLLLTPNGQDELATYSASHIGAYLVIAQDDIVFLSPMVQTQIMDGAVSITAIMDEEAAKVLAAQANSGKMPFQLVIEE